MSEFPSGKSSAERLPSPEKGTARKALILEHGEEKTYDDSLKFLGRFGVRNWVRFTPDEFDAIDPESQYIDHFNLEKTDSVVGQKYIVMKILRNGVRSPDPQQEIPPLLSLDGACIVECVEVENNLPYSAITERHLEHSLKGISDSESLKTAILKKYRKSMPDLTDEDAANKGVAHTRFRFIERVEK